MHSDIRNLLLAAGRYTGQPAAHDEIDPFKRIEAVVERYTQGATKDEHFTLLMTRCAQGSMLTVLLPIFRDLCPELTHDHLVLIASNAIRQQGRFSTLLPPAVARRSFEKLVSEVVFLLGMFPTSRWATEVRRATEVCQGTIPNGAQGAPAGTYLRLFGILALLTVNDNRENGEMFRVLFTAVAREQDLKKTDTDVRASGSFTRTLPTNDAFRSLLQDLGVPDHLMPQDGRPSPDPFKLRKFALRAKLRYSDKNTPATMPSDYAFGGFSLAGSTFAASRDVVDNDIALDKDVLRPLLFRLMQYGLHHKKGNTALVGMIYTAANSGLVLFSLGPYYKLVADALHISDRAAFHNLLMEVAAEVVLTTDDNIVINQDIPASFEMDEAEIMFVRSVVEDQQHAAAEQAEKFLRECESASVADMSQSEKIHLLLKHYFSTTFDTGGRFTGMQAAEVLLDKFGLVKFVPAHATLEHMCGLMYGTAVLTPSETVALAEHSAVLYGVMSPFSNVTFWISTRTDTVSPQTEPGEAPHCPNVTDPIYVPSAEGEVPSETLGSRILRLAIDEGLLDSNPPSVQENVGVKGEVAYAKLAARPPYFREEGSAIGSVRDLTRQYTLDGNSAWDVPDAETLRGDDMVTIPSWVLYEYIERTRLVWEANNLGSGPNYLVEGRGT